MKPRSSARLAHLRDYLAARTAFARTSRTTYATQRNIYRACWYLNRTRELMAPLGWECVK